MSARLFLTQACARLTMKRLLNRNYQPATARRLLASNRHAVPVTRVGAIDWEARGPGAASASVLYVAGGGFILPPNDSHRKLLDDVCRHADSDAFLLHYRLAPEHPFPAAYDDTVEALGILNALGKPFVVIADSAGASLVIAAAATTTDRYRFLAGIALISPLVDLAMTGLSHVANRYRDPLFGPEAIIHKNHHYLQGANPTDPAASPLWGTLTGLPPLHIIVGSTEVLLDDSVRLAEKVNRAGGHAALTIVPGAPHTLPILFPRNPESRRTVESITSFVIDQIGAHQTPTAEQP